MRIIILSQAGCFVNILYNFLAPEYDIEKVVLEQPVSRFTVLKRRIKSLGFKTALGQAAFIAMVVPFLKKEAQGRYQNIIRDNKINLNDIPADKTMSVNSVNSQEALSAIKESKPDLIVVSGTRLISAKTLGLIKSPIINIHAGITPLYRGGHGGYWALVNKDVENCGVTIHRIDRGIDTGEIVAQESIIPDKEDNFTTYPLLQLIAGAKLLKKIIPEIIDNNYSKIEKPGKSRLWSHPTIWGYLRQRISMKVK